MAHVVVGQLVFEGLSIHAFTTGAIAVDDVPPLDEEAFPDLEIAPSPISTLVHEFGRQIIAVERSMEAAPLIMQSCTVARSALFTGAQATEVFARLGRTVTEYFFLDMLYSRYMSLLVIWAYTLFSDTVEAASFSVIAAHRSRTSRDLGSAKSATFASARAPVKSLRPTRALLRR